MHFCHKLIGFVLTLRNENAATVRANTNNITPKNVLKPPIKLNVKINMSLQNILLQHILSCQCVLGLPLNTAGPITRSESCAL